MHTNSQLDALIAQIAAAGYTVEQLSAYHDVCVLQAEADEAGKSIEDTYADYCEDCQDDVHAYVAVCLSNMGEFV